MLVSKAALAEELAVSRARISQFVQLGMPVRADGRIDLLVACRWILDNIDLGIARGHAAELIRLARH